MFIYLYILQKTEGKFDLFFKNVFHIVLYRCGQFHVLEVKYKEKIYDNEYYPSTSFIKIITLEDYFSRWCEDL